MSTMTGEVMVSRIERRDELEHLEPEWDRLLRQADVASPFLTPGWQMAWLDTYGTKHRLYVLVARRAGELVGLWPLGRRRRGLFRVLEPIAAGRSDWLDIPVVTGQREVVVPAFLSYLTQHRSGWDLLELRDVLADSPTIPLLTALCATGRIRLRRQPRTISPYLALQGNWEQFLGSKRPKFRSNLKYYRRLPEREGKRFEIRRLAWGDGDGPIDDLVRIERGSWKAREGNLKVSTALGREFYRRFCQYFAGKGWLDVWSADIDDVPVAFVLNIIYGGKCYHYNTSYVESAANISPGVLLHADAISDAFQRNLAEYDFLSGDEPYKERWCSDRRGIDHLAFHHASPTSRAAFAGLVELRWAARQSKALTGIRQRLLAAIRKTTRKDRKGTSTGDNGG